MSSSPLSYSCNITWLSHNTRDTESNMEGKASFIPPVIEDNPDGWGPCSIPTAFKDIPYQPFSKGDRLGKVKPQVVMFLSRVGKIRKTGWKIMPRWFSGFVAKLV